MIEQLSTNDFFISSLSEENPYNSVESVLSDLREVIKTSHYDVKQVPLTEIGNGWDFHKKTENLHHKSSAFFSIEGINVQTNFGHVHSWQQPIIHQPEIGILGIICKKHDGILHFLLQAKIEPGNVNIVQLSPTLQATKSNYTQIHKGSQPQFLEHFLRINKGKVLLDQLQSEQCSKFYKKRNRNIILEIQEDIELPDNFYWLTLGQIKKLLQYDNIVNMDTRSVLSCIDYGDHFANYSSHSHIGLDEHYDYHDGMRRSYFERKNILNTVDQIISWIAEINSQYRLSTERIPLAEIKDWHRDEYEIYHKDKRFFSIIGVHVSIEGREVDQWSQPLVRSTHQGVIAFLIKRINGTYHFLVQARVEAGNMDTIELAPTVQCINDDISNCPTQHLPPYLNYVLNAPEERTHFNALQSEEGGRFYQEQHRYKIIEVEEDFPVQVPRDYMWMTLSQISLFIRFNNYFNIEARSIIAAISFIK